jgi:hypothetical protein
MALSNRLCLPIWLLLAVVAAKTKFHTSRATLNGHTLLGIGVLLGFEGPNCVVQRVLPGSELEHSGSVSPGDRIVSIGGIKLRKKKLGQLQKQLQRLPSDVPLVFSRQIQTVQLSRSSNASAFGFQLKRRYGMTSAPPTVHIGKIIEGSVAAASETLEPGTELLTVNGEAVAGMDMRVVAAQVQLAFPTATLEVRVLRNLSKSEPLFSHVPQPNQISLSGNAIKGEGDFMGVHGAFKVDQDMVVTSHSGEAIFSGCHLVGVGNIGLQGMTPKEVYSTIKAEPSNSLWWFVNTSDVQAVHTTQTIELEVDSETPKSTGQAHPAFSSTEAQDLRESITEIRDGDDKWCNIGETGAWIGSTIRAIGDPHTQHQPSDRKDLIVTYTSLGYVSFTMNLLASFQHANITSPAELVVLALDEGSYELLCARRVPCWYSTTFAKSSGASLQAGQEEIANFGTKQFNMLSQQKITAIHALLGRGYNVFATDGDIAWKRDPFPSLEAYNKPVVLMSSEGTELNTGYFYAQSTEGVRSLFAEVIRCGNEHVEMNDQDCFNHVKDKRTDADVADLMVGFPARLYPNGCQFPDSDKDNIYVFHATCRVGFAAKRQYLKETGNWFLQPEWDALAADNAPDLDGLLQLITSPIDLVV